MNELSDNEALLMESLARGMAVRAMKDHGAVPPTVLIGNENTVIEYASEALADAAAKDRLAQIARLLATANDATVVTTILESWARIAKVPGGPMTERIEAVMIMTEHRQGSRALLLKIERTEHGKFRRLTPVSMPGLDSVQGRFTGLIPPRSPSPEEMTQARTVLGLLGLSPDGKTIRHDLN